MNYSQANAFKQTYHHLGTVWVQVCEMVKAIKFIVCLSLFLAFGVIGLYTSIIPSSPGSIKTVQEKLTADAQQALLDAKQSNWAELKIIGQKAFLSGEAPNQDAKDQAIHSLALATGKKGFFLGGITQIDSSQVTLGPYIFKADYRTDFIRISKNLPSLREQTEVNDYLKVLFPQKQIFLQTQIVGGPPNKEWTQTVKTALHAISSLEEGVILIENKVVKISGIAFSDIERNIAIERAGNIGNEYSFVTKITVNSSYKNDSNINVLNDEIAGDTILEENNISGLDEVDNQEGDFQQDIDSQQTNKSQSDKKLKDDRSTAIQIPRAEDVVKTRIILGTQQDNLEEQNITQIEESSKGLPPTPEPKEEFQQIPSPLSGPLLISPQNEPQIDSRVTASLGTDSPVTGTSNSQLLILERNIENPTSIAPTILPPAPSLQSVTSLEQTPPTQISQIKDANNGNSSIDEKTQLLDNQIATPSLGRTSQSLYVPAADNTESKVSEQFRLCQNELIILLEQQPINFNKESSIIVNSSRPTIASIANTLKRCQSGFSFEITGHTDIFDDEVKNQQLSSERAQATKRLLVLRGVKADKMISVGLGSSSPLKQNNDRRARKQNNRIDIFLINDQTN